MLKISTELFSRPLLPASVSSGIETCSWRVAAYDNRALSSGCTLQSLRSLLIPKPDNTLDYLHQPWGWESGSVKASQMNPMHKHLENQQSAWFAWVTSLGSTEILMDIEASFCQHSQLKRFGQMQTWCLQEHTICPHMHCGRFLGSTRQVSGQNLLSWVGCCICLNAILLRWTLGWKLYLPQTVTKN